MRRITNNTWGRMILAFVVVLLVAGPGLVLAGNPGPSYTPTGAQLVGPSTVTKGSTATVSLNVTFGDAQNSVAVYGGGTAAGATFTTAALGASIDSLGNYSAPTTGTKDKITGYFSQAGVTVQAYKYIVLK